MSDNERPFHVTGALNLTSETAHGKLIEELAKFFIAAWDAYCDNPSEELQWIIEETDLIARRSITQEDIDNDLAPEGHDVDDYMFVLTDMGKEALRVMQAASDRRKAELGVVKPQSSPFPFPLSGQPPCAKHPDSPCLDGCEFGFVGPCLRETGWDTQGDAP